MNENKWLNLQLFAGEGDGGGEGAATGESAVDPGQQRLLELGVPADKIRKRAQKSAPKLPGAGRTAPNQEPQQTKEQAAAAENPAEDNKTDVPGRMSWEEIMADPEYNKQMQSVVQSRLRSAKAAEESLAKLTPALELLARRHGLDANNMDYDAIAKAINDDDSYYEDKALEMGVTLETAKRIDQQERDDARRQKQEQMNLEQQMFHNHIVKLEQQSEALRKVFPKFDLRSEMKNPVFARLTSPNMGMSVEDAYYAVHRKEIDAARSQVIAQQTTQKISNQIQSGSRRPDENGTSGQSASVTTFDYAKASKAQRDALKKQIYAARARGEKVYPGR